jgi:hypothetical protein
MQTPDQIKEHDAKFAPDAWTQYTVAELAMWVHLLRKRADMRTEPTKSAKDCADADNYEAMLRAALGRGGV